MGQIKLNATAPTMESIPRQKAWDEANTIVKKNSIIESLFGLPDNERMALRDALMEAILNKPKLKTNEQMNSAQQTISDSRFEDIGDTFLGINYTGRGTSTDRDKAIKQLADLRHKTITEIIPSTFKHRER